jgi:hypothetical protein
MPAPAAITLIVTLLLMSSGAAGSDTSRKPAALDGGPLISIPVDVFAPPEMKESAVDRICAETDAIWRPAGITFTWHRRASTEALDASRLHVTIDHQRLSPTDEHTTLGWIMFTGGEAEPSIHVSIAGAEDLLLGANSFDNTVTVRHDMLIDRALGRALSHELGHYLLGSKTHTPRGLMRASWPPRQVFGEERRGFELSAEQRSVAAQRVRSENRAVLDRESGEPVPGRTERNETSRHYTS